MPIPYRKEWVKQDGRKLVGGGPRDRQRAQQMQTLSQPTDAAIIESLRDTIQELREELHQTREVGPKPDGYFSPEEVDEEIRKAVEQAVRETTMALKKSQQAKEGQNLEPILQKYKTQIVELQKNNDDLARLHKELTTKNGELRKQVEELKSQITQVNVDDLKLQIRLLEQKLEDKNETIELLKYRNVESEDVLDTDRPQIEQKFVDPLDKGSTDGLKSHLKFEDISDEEEEMTTKVDKLKGLLGKLPSRT